jgi:hypothetical protein
MQAGDAGRAARFDQLADQFHVHMLECLRAARVENADQVDHRVGALQRLLQGGGIVHVGGTHMHRRQHAQRAVLFAVAAEQHDAVAVGGQSRHQRAADETGAAEDDDLLCGHWINPLGEARVRARR